MPKLRRIRMVSIGHNSARFEDVTFDFRDADDNATNSIMWLRNGGGKTSLLSLFFASIRPNKNDFLGKRAEAKARRIEDYVSHRDQSVVVCEWQLDDVPKLYDGDVQLYLSGFFYQRKSDEDSGSTKGIEPAYFATKVLESEPELTLDGLPLELTSDRSDNESTRIKRRTITSFRRRWRQLIEDRPESEAFLSREQNKFAEELTDRGIDPELFFYQIMMNQREGGVSARFAFSEAEQFVDFLLEMTFDRNRSKQVKDQLSTFRHELKERNEQLLPEKELCNGLTKQLQQLQQIRNRRMDIVRESNRSSKKLDRLQEEIIQWIDENRTQHNQATQKLEVARTELNRASETSDRLLRKAVVLAECSLRRTAERLQAEYADQESAMRNAEKLKSIWEAAVPLSRVKQCQAEARRHRSELERKQKHLEPDRKRLVDAGTDYANAMEFKVEQLKSEQSILLEIASEQRKQAGRLLSESSKFGESAATAESQANHLGEKVADANKQFCKLVRDGCLSENESLTAALLRYDDLIGEKKALVEELSQKKIEEESTRLELIDRKAKCEARKSDLRTEIALAQSSLTEALDTKKTLESNDALLRLLQTESIDAEVSATKAIKKASEESPRVYQAILDLEVESVEDKRNVFALEDSQLLPPSRDVQLMMSFLKEQGVTCYAGWKYLASNFPATTIRERISDLPHIAAGIVVADKDFEQVLEMPAGVMPRLATPVVVSPTSAVKDDCFSNWRVFGPTSDAHFDSGTSREELQRLKGIVETRDQEICSNRRWHQSLTDLLIELRNFRKRYPRGWFAESEEKLHSLESHLEECKSEIDSTAQTIFELEERIEGYQSCIEEAEKEIRSSEYSRERVQTFQEMFGQHVDRWKSQQIDESNKAKELRERQANRKQKSTECYEEADQSKEQASRLFNQTANSQQELAKIVYVDESRRKAVAGILESLQRSYEELRDIYEDKLDKDGLRALADKADQQTKIELKEFRRVLTNQRGITEDDVELQLSTLPPSVTATERKEGAEQEYKSIQLQLARMAKPHNAAKDKHQIALNELNQLRQSGPLPEISPTGTDVQILAESNSAREQAAEQVSWQTELKNEVVELTAHLTALNHEKMALEKDRERAQSIFEGQAPFLARVAALHSNEELKSSSIPISSEKDFSRLLDEIQEQLKRSREHFSKLDEEREEVARRIHQFTGSKQFDSIPDSIGPKFRTRSSDVMELNSHTDLEQVSNRVFQIERQLETADKQLEIVIGIVLSAANDGLTLLNRVSNLSRLPASLPQAGKRFIEIKTGSADDPNERRIKIRDFVNEILEQGEIGEGLTLIQKAVRRIASPIKVRVLHPDLYQNRPRFNIQDLGLFSGGEVLTVAILLYCTLVRMRRQQGHGKSGSSVLVLDNPIGTASRISFLDMQREVAAAMNVQLIYATAVKDLDAVGCLENIIALKNSRADRRTGKRLVELDEIAQSELERKIEAARVVFNRAPASLANSPHKSSGESIEEEPVSNTANKATDE